MRVVTLVENTSKIRNLKPKHGLSLYIETSKHKILFDLGPDSTYIHNAEELEIDLSEVDIVVISHGHVDHGGALPSFLKINNKAKIFISRKAFDLHYIKILFSKVYIGLNKDLVLNERFILTDGNMKIDDELFLLSDVTGHFDTNSNIALLTKTPDGYVKDEFVHEQNLIVSIYDRGVLFSGCSHKGIANIVRAARKHHSGISTVFGGFHLYNSVTKRIESVTDTQQLAKKLLKYDITYYTGHCTGSKAFKIMQRMMKSKIQQLSTGSVITMYDL